MMAHEHSSTSGDLLGGEETINGAASKPGEAPVATDDGQRRAKGVQRRKIVGRL
jgi:hypothetical protein